MHWPRHSLGDNITQPSTPCSASTECGGRRSVLSTSAAGLRWRAFFKSAPLPALSVMESITAKGDTQRAGSVNDSLDRDVRNLFTGYWHSDHQELAKSF